MPREEQKPGSENMTEKHADFQNVMEKKCTRNMFTY